MPEPVSFCSTMTPSGMQINRPMRTRSPRRVIEKEYSLMRRAMASAVAILANSTGCTRNEPNSNHALAPFTSRPKRSAATSSTMPAK